MPLLLEDIAEETKSSTQRLAERLDAEAHDLAALEREAAELQRKVTEPHQVDSLRQLTATLKKFRTRAVESAQEAIDYAISQMPRCEVLWLSGLTKLRQNPRGEDAGRLLRLLLDVFTAGLRFVRAARGLWQITQRFGTPADRVEELDRADEWFQHRVREAQSALEHRGGSWQPADPERLRLGLQLAREGRTVKAGEAQARFRHSRD
jgi:hypothetical protein